MGIAMTAISANSAALTILTQSSTFAQGTSNSAADAILDIVSGRTAGGKAAEEATSAAAKASAAEKANGAPRAVGGSVSSEISRAMASAMSAATVNGLSYDDPLIAFIPVKPSVENAEAYVRSAIGSVDVFNKRLEPNDIVLPREEYSAIIVARDAAKIANGEDAEKVNRQTELFLSDKFYQNYVNYIEYSNEVKFVRSARASEMISSANDRLFEVFGSGLKITYNDKGEGRIEPFELHYIGGQKMLSYSEDGSLTTYNEDGSVRNAYNGKTAALIEV